MLIPVEAAANKCSFIAGLLACLVQHCGSSRSSLQTTKQMAARHYTPPTPTMDLVLQTQLSRVVIAAAGIGSPSDPHT